MGWSNADNKFGPTPFVVGPPASGLGNGVNYISIQTAINDANAVGGGVVYIRYNPVPYVENLSLFNNVQLHGVNVDGRLPSGVVIEGNHSFSPVIAGLNLVAIENINFTAAAGDNFTLAPAAGCFAVLATKFCNFQSSAPLSRNIVANPDPAGFVNYVSTLSTYDAQGPCFDFTVEPSQMTFERGSASSNSFECARLGASQSSTFRHAELSGATYGITTSGSSIASEYSSYNSGLENINMTASVTYQASHNMYSCNAGSGFYIIGPVGSNYFYADETIQGPASGIDPNITQIKNTWRPTAEIGAAPGTGVARGTACFDSAQFTNSDGFIQVIPGSVGLTWSDQAVSTTVGSFTGSFATAGIPITLTLPTAAAIGTVCEFKLDSIGPLTVMADVADKIRLGTSLSGSGGTATTTAQGDALTLTYRATASTWIADSIIGNWSVI